MQYASHIIFNTSETAVLTLSVARALSLPQRLRGLLGRPPPPKGCALLIGRCGSVHTLGMKYPLDLVFLDKNRRVTRVVQNVPPNRPFICGGLRAVSVLETSAGWLPPGLLRPGMEGQMGFEN